MPEKHEPGTEETKFTLNPLQAQQLKRDLLTRAIQKETEFLLTTNLIRALRPKETVTQPTSPESSSTSTTETTPLLQFFFKRYVLTFPFLTNTDLPNFLDKLEQFQDELLKARISSDSERSDTTKRQLVVLRIEKMLVLLFNNATPIELKNLNINPPSPTSTPTTTLPEPTTINEPPAPKQPPNGTQYMMDIVGVRQEKIKGTFKKTTQTKFIFMACEPEGTSVYYTFKTYDDFKALVKKLRRLCPLAELPPLPDKIKDKLDTTKFYREQDRMNLRSVFRRIMGIPEVANRPEIYHFLTQEAAELTDSDLQDISERKEHMLFLAEDRRKFHHFIATKAQQFKTLWADCKQDLFRPNGLEHFETMLKSTSQIVNLPPHFRGAMDWGKLNFASFLYTFFCTTDDSARFYHNLCSTHKLVPYKTLSTILRYTNPTGMAKAVLDLLLAQPFGSTSLFQRLLTTSFTDQARDTQKEIQQLEATIQDEALCQRIQNFVYHPELRSEQLREAISDFERLTVIINDPQIEPELTPDAIKKFWGAREWVDLYLDGKNPPVPIIDDQPQYPEFHFLETLHQLYVLQTRKRDAEKISDLLFQGLTGELMKNILSVFYEPLAQVYKDANIADFVMKISLFMDDLIQVIQKIYSNEFDANSDCGHVQHFIDLIARHEQDFYSFIHSIYNSDSNDLFHNLLNWTDGLLSAIRDKVIDQQLDMQGLVEQHVPTTSTPKLRSDLAELEAYHVRRKLRQAHNLHRKLVTTERDDMDEIGLMIDVTQGVVSDVAPSTTEAGPSPSRHGRQQSLVDFGFGNVALDDIRDIEETSMTSFKASQPNQIHFQQSLVNANPSEPMLVWLNDRSDPTPGSDSQPVGDTLSVDAALPASDHSSVASHRSNPNPNDDTPQRITKFTTPKTVAGISQEPYPANIHLLPSLLTPFLQILTATLKP